MQQHAPAADLLSSNQFAFSSIVHGLSEKQLTFRVGSAN
jgi:hypothetical protein